MKKVLRMDVINAKKIEKATVCLQTKDGMVGTHAFERPFQMEQYSRSSLLLQNQVQK